MNMTNLSRRGIAVVAMLLMAGWGFAAFRRPKPPVDLSSVGFEIDPPPVATTRFHGPRTPPIELLPLPSDYVGSDVCRRCHEPIANEYHGHPMARSLTSVAEYLQSEGEIADTVIEPPGARRYRVRRETGHLWHHEFLPNASSEPVYDQAVEMAYVLGSGTRGRAFLAEHDERLFDSPIHWSSQKKTWSLAAGYSPEQHPRFERETGDDCLACHAGHVNRPVEKSPKYGSPTFSEMSIGCERCHGPGGAHVTWHESRPHDKPDENSATVPDPIVNPAKLEAARRDDVCNQCHLHGHSRQLRFGRTNFDFRPGMRLDDVWLIFVSRERVPSDNREYDLSHSEQIQHSACFRQSDGRFGCVSCHAPHSVPSPIERTKFYQERCMKCHTEAGCSVPEAERNTSPSHGSCLVCHMPRRETHDSPHTPRTDHRILRRPNQRTPDQSGNTPIIEDSPLRWRLFDNAEPRVSDWEIRRARGLMMAGLAQRIGPSPFAAEGLRLLEPLAEAIPEDRETQEWIGVCELLTGREALAKARWTLASTKVLRRESLLKRLAFLTHDRRDWKAAEEYLDRLVEINPWRSDFHSRHAQVREALGDSDHAAKSARRAIELNPTLSQAHELLARTYQLKGELELSGKHRELAETLRKAGF